MLLLALNAVPAPPVKSMEMALVGEGLTPFINELVLLPLLFKFCWLTLLWKKLLLLLLLLPKLLSFLLREEGDTDDAENLKLLLFCEAGGLLIGVIMGIPLNLISLGEEAAEEALDWVSWSSSESDCIAVSYIPLLGLLR